MPNDPYFYTWTCSCSGGVSQKQSIVHLTASFFDNRFWPSLSIVKPGPNSSR
jgi:hypothetical protein